MRVQSWAPRCLVRHLSSWFHKGRRLRSRGPEIVSSMGIWFACLVFPWPDGTHTNVLRFRASRRIGHSRETARVFFVQGREWRNCIQAIGQGAKDGRTVVLMLRQRIRHDLRREPAHPSFARFSGLFQFSCQSSTPGGDGVQWRQGGRDVSIKMLNSG
jgi:hypothetical protein